MKIYVAGKFEEKEVVRDAQKRVREIGYEVTHDWTGEDPGERTGEELEAFLRDCAIGDYEGVLNADCVLLLNHDRAFGAMVETGLALAWGKVVYVVAPQVRDNIFYHLPPSMGVRLFRTLQAALEALEEDLALDTDDCLEVENGDTVL